VIFRGLSSDAFSGISDGPLIVFNSLGWGQCDPNVAAHNAEVTECTVFLFEVQIPVFAKAYLDTFIDNDSFRKKDDSFEDVSSKYLCTLLHKFGMPPTTTFTFIGLIFRH
jgi:hypothetical protein